MNIESLFVRTVAMTANSSRRGLLSGCSTFLTSSGNAGASEELGYVQNAALRSHCLADAAAGIEYDLRIQESSGRQAAAEYNHYVRFNGIQFIRRLFKLLLIHPQVF